MVDVLQLHAMACIFSNLLERQIAHDCAKVLPNLGIIVLCLLSVM